MAGTTKSGRKATATADKKLRGNPGQRRLNDNEPQGKLLEKVPEPPSWLGEHAIKVWHTNGAVLIEMMLLTDADLDLFATFCQAMHVMIESSLDINEHGMTILGARGRVRNPALATFASATQTIRSLASEFGMTPSSRTRLKMPGESGETLDDFLNGQNGKDDVE